MSELNEQVTVTVDDTPAITVNTPLVEDFTAENAAPKASAVGAALALKVDRNGIMENVVININDETHSDNQGKILLYGDMIPTESGSNKPSVTAAIGTVEGKLYGDQLPMSSGDSTKIAAAISNVAAKTANEIYYVGGTTIKTKVDALETGMGNMLQKTAQELTTEEKAAVRANIGLGAAAQKGVANDLTTSTGGEYVLDAAQGYQLKTQIDTLDTKVTEHINAPLMVAEVSMAAAQSIAAGDTATGITVDVPTVTGYRAIGIVGHRFSGTNVSWLNVYRLTLDVDEETGAAIVTLNVRNEYAGTGTGTASLTAYFNVLYMKTASAG